MARREVGDYKVRQTVNQGSVARNNEGRNRRRDAGNELCGMLE